jgi:solute carrier family 41
MSPILRREIEYDPQKRRATWWNELAEAQRDETEHNDPPPIPDGQSSLVDSPGKGIQRHRSYGSDQGSVASDTEGKEVECVERETSPYLKRNILHLALTLAIQSTPSLLLSLVGVIFTGQLLDHLAVWSVFRRVDELFILVPVLVSTQFSSLGSTNILQGNLKGNLEMCLGARLGTSVRPLLPPATSADAPQANRGHLDTITSRRRIITHALNYLLLQALVISSIAGVLSFFLGLALNHRIADGDTIVVPSPVGSGPEGPHREGYTPPGGKEFTLVVGTGMVAACLSSLVLGSFMAWLVIGCRWFGLDPDNIASPLAATLGDLLTLFIMALVGSALVKTIDTPLPFVVMLGMCGATGGIWFALRMMARRREGRGKRTEAMEDEAEEGGWSPLVSQWAGTCDTVLILSRSER